MKNIYAIFALLLLTAGINAQTILVTFEGEEVGAGDTVKVEIVAGEENTSYFNLTNMSETALSVRSAYSKLQTNAGDEFLMCMGECTMDTISLPVTLEPQVEFTGFDIAFTPATNNTTLIKVFLYAEGATDAALEELHSFYVKYHDPEVSLAETAKTQPLSAVVYPNPMKESAVLDYFVPSKYSNPQMIVRNMVGKVVKTYNLKSGEQSKLKINSSSLSAGVYFYSIVSESETLSTKKLVIRK